MRHRVSGRKFNRNTNQRKALLNGLSESLVSCGMINTTVAKAKSVRPIVEKLVTKAKKGDLSSYRYLLSKISKNACRIMIDKIVPAVGDRPGGYTRIIKNGFRSGDNAPMAIISFVDSDAVSNVLKYKEKIK
jgi:large subunit ribosomal protein L17